MKNKNQIYLKLFTSTFYLSTFTFGGGFVIIPLMKKKFVDDLKWIEEEEMLNLTAIAQSSPGAVAVNASILLGYQVAGITGALVSILGTVLPPLIILSIISTFYAAFRDNIVVNAVLKAMQAGVAAVICDVVLTMGSSISKSKDIVSILVMVLAFIATYVFKINVMYIILVCGIIGALKVILVDNKKKVGDRR
ncbi:chromate transporter%2C chromate ion transporter (CHR) family [uncultured Clostridium sp.]|uniref:chromate transporter n=1 Tax=uncultured Clostridium sp. TaxID=59620 RepID=UPI000822E705|nr:chromate transporter [uncultured Clostridium sp.]SCJ10477.1 chromate transporter%2C chromate ion transporter (CHR) family [uncultured Clostridium sp.]